MFRRLESGTHPDLEVSQFLTDREFPNVPPVAGWYQYRRENGDLITAGILTQLVPEAKDAWPTTLEILSRYFERVRVTPT